MSKNNIQIINDEDGFIIVSIAGKEFISNEPLMMVNGKFKSSEFVKLIFTENS
jgi:hypothetical protein